jgi:hypothetical protein
MATSPESIHLVAAFEDAIREQADCETTETRSPDSQWVKERLAKNYGSAAQDLLAHISVLENPQALPITNTLRLQRDVAVANEQNCRVINNQLLAENKQLKAELVALHKIYGGVCHNCLTNSQVEVHDNDAFCWRCNFKWTIEV